MKLACIPVLMAMALSGLAAAEPTTQPVDSATQPAEPTEPRGVEADKMLDQLLRSQPGTARSIRPMAPETEKIDVASTRQAVAPTASAMPLKREGNMISHRVARLQRTADKQGWELHFESDGKTMLDPPMIVLPSIELAKMENQLQQSSRDLRFIVTGMITEYHGRNYLLVEKVDIQADDIRP
jgi:hypothetical protein